MNNQLHDDNALLSWLHYRPNLLHSAALDLVQILLMNLNVEMRYIAGKHQVSCEVSGEAVILDMKKGTYFGLNSVGASIWKLLREARTLPELQRAIVAEYEVEPAQCLLDIRALLGQFLEHGLVEADVVGDTR